MSGSSSRKIARLSARLWPILLAVGLLAFAAALSACGGGGDDGGANGGVSAQELVGTFLLDVGACEGTDPTTYTGSFFRMRTPDGVNYFPNNDSPCGDKSHTSVSPGTDGGLSTVDFQPYPDPPCDEEGNGTAGAIHPPQGFAGIKWGSATQADVVLGDGGPASPAPSAPSITFDPGTGKLSGQTSAFGMCWQNNYFAQGNPRINDPDDLDGGGLPSNCDDDQPPLSGTYDADTGFYTLEWSSRIGSAFGCGFIGFWHFEGTFQAG